MSIFKSLPCLCLLVLSPYLQAQKIALIPIKSGFSKPVDISSTGIPGDGRLFITEKDGKVKILYSDGTVLQTPFLDIDPIVNSQANERGLLGLCFHPDYATNGYFYVNYTNNSGHTTVSRFKTNASNPNTADADSEKIILTINQPFNNHNAGDLNFGADGFLYIGTGDGGSGGDPGNRSQNPKERLGKMLRIDVNTESEKYLIPSSNPFVNNPDTLPEIWALGLRNPWRFSFDKSENTIWIADVGQDRWEEINAVNAEIPGVNYGWRCYEGFSRFNFNGCDDKRNYQSPVFAYENVFDIGCSVTGGYVYRGAKNPGLYGKYIYTDFCTGIFWALSKDNSGIWRNDVLADLDNMEFATFGVDNEDELYVAGLGNGTIYAVLEKVSSTQEPEDSKPTFTIHPNPARQYITVTKPESTSLYNVWHIYDISGNRVNTFAPEGNSNTFTVNISSLPTGAYYIKPIDAYKGIKFIKH